MYSEEKLQRRLLKILKYTIPGTDTWTSGPSMPIARHGLAAADIGEKIYVIGGGPEPDISFANVVEILNVGTNGVNTGTAETAETAETPSSP